MLKFLAALSVLLLSACAFTPEDKYSMYPHDQSQAMVLEKAGTDVPTNITLAPTYEEYFTWYAAWGATWNCTASKTKSGTKLLIIQEREGNLIRGVHVTSEPCSEAVQLTFEGRFNATHLYIRFSPEKPGYTSAVRRFQLVEGGNKLVEEENYVMKNGVPHTHVYPRSGAEREERKYETSYFYVSKVSLKEVLAKASVDKARADELIKRQNQINWGAGMAGLTGIVADAQKQQAANIAANEKRRQQLDTQLREQRAQERAAQQAPTKATQQPSKTGTTTVSTAKPPTAGIVVADAEPKTQLVEQKRAPVQQARGALHGGELPQTVYMYCSGGSGKFVNNKFKKFYTKLVAVTRIPLENRNDTKEFRDHVEQQYGDRPGGTCEHRSNRAEVERLRANSLADAAKDNKRVEIVHLSWVPAPK